jgi:hypothetical protein
MIDFMTKPAFGIGGARANRFFEKLDCVKMLILFENAIKSIVRSSSGNSTPQKMYQFEPCEV